MPTGYFKFFDPVVPFVNVLLDPGLFVLAAVVKFLVEAILVLSAGSLESDPVGLAAGLLAIGVVLVVFGASTLGVPTFDAVFVLLDVVAGFLSVLGVFNTEDLVVYILDSGGGFVIVEVAVLGLT